MHSSLGSTLRFCSFSGCCRQFTFWCASFRLAHLSDELFLSRYRVKDLSGVSVQDAEVKLVTAEPNAPGENSVEESGGNNIANKGVIGGQEEGTANKTKRKKKTKAKQATTRQRGPLLITHTGASNI